MSYRILSAIKYHPCYVIQHIILHTVVVCTFFSGKEPHWQVDVGIVLTSGSLHGVMFSTLAWGVRDVGSIRTLGTIFPFSFSIFCEGEFILSLTSKPENTGLFSLLASCFWHSVIYHTEYLASVGVPSTLFLIVSIGFIQLLPKHIPPPPHMTLLWNISNVLYNIVWYAVQHM